MVTPRPLVDWRPLVRLGSGLDALVIDEERPVAPRVKEGALPQKLPSPGRAAPTPGFLLPLAREYRFRQRPDEATRAQRQQQLAFLLLAIWEEEAELEEQSAFWAQQQRLVMARPEARPSCWAAASDDSLDVPAGQAGEAPKPDRAQRRERRDYRATCRPNLCRQQSVEEQQQQLQVRIDSDQYAATREHVRSLLRLNSRASRGAAGWLRDRSHSRLSGRRSERAGEKPPSPDGTRRSPSRSPSRRDMSGNRSGRVRPPTLDMSRMAVEDRGLPIRRGSQGKLIRPPHISRGRSDSSRSCRDDDDAGDQSGGREAPPSSRRVLAAPLPRRSSRGSSRGSGRCPSTRQPAIPSADVEMPPPRSSSGSLASSRTPSTRRVPMTDDVTDGLAPADVESRTSGGRRSLSRSPSTSCHRPPCVEAQLPPLRRSESCQGSVGSSSGAGSGRCSSTSPAHRSRSLSSDSRNSRRSNVRVSINV